MWYVHEGVGWWMIFGGIWMVLFWGGLIALIIWGINRLTRKDGKGSSYRSIDIIKERYARGEISREEYEQIRKDLL